MSCNFWGRIVRSEGPEFVVARQDNATDLVQCVPRRKRFKRGKPVVGDLVDVAPDGERGLIIDVRKREVLLSRAGSNPRRPQAIVANIDTLVVTASAQTPPLRPGLLDRYIVAALQQGLTPLLCFNKWELAQQDDETIAVDYSKLGYPTVFCSAARGDGVEQLRQLLTKRRSAFVGHSGVGKTSLLRHFFPEYDFAVGDLDKQGRGRHTTTHAQLLPLGQGYVVDTPGIREFGLIQVEAEELAKYWAEFAAYDCHCRFLPCSHTHEPDCAIKEAVEAGALSMLRYEGYLKLHEELSEQEKLRY